MTHNERNIAVSCYRYGTAGKPATMSIHIIPYNEYDANNTIFILYLQYKRVLYETTN